jgi:hypothetical protein
MPAVGVRVYGFREIQAAGVRAGREIQVGLRGSLREVAEPVRRDVETLASSSIRRIGPKWSRMRTGVTQTLVYVAPKQRGVRTRGPDPRRRPNLADLLMDRAMEPALERHEQQLEAVVEQMLDRVAAEFNR